jgi:hypothetical protein
MLLRLSRTNNSLLLLLWNSSCSNLFRSQTLGERILFVALLYLSRVFSLREGSGESAISDFLLSERAVEKD